jgi:hypothetical protein
MTACELALGAKRAAARISQVQFKPSTPSDNQTSMPQETQQSLIKMLAGAPVEVPESQLWFLLNP